MKRMSDYELTDLDILGIKREIINAESYVNKLERLLKFLIQEQNKLVKKK